MTGHWLSMSAWVSVLWAWGLPLLAALPALAQVRAWRMARRRELLRPRGWRWLLVALTAAIALIGLGQLTLIYSTNFIFPSLGLAAVVVLLVAVRAARPEVHPALRGFRRPLPRDGLALIDSGAPASPRLYVSRFTLLLPALALLLYIALHHPHRWLDFVLLGLILTAPLGLIPYRHLWLWPVYLAFPWFIWLGQAWEARAALPPEVWASPITGARCAGPLTVIRPTAQAWCINALTHQLYRFDLDTGIVNLSTTVPEGVRVFAATADTAWIQQRPAHGLVRVTALGQARFAVNSAHQGAASADGRLWVLDVGQELTVFDGQDSAPVRARDGLLNNTANVVRASPAGEVWVGSIGGASVWRSTGWETYDRERGVPGSVINIAFDDAGGGWLLWQERPGYSALTAWGVSQLLSDGHWRHLDLGQATGLEAPRIEDALAVDGAGRVWFVTQALLRREKFLVTVGGLDAPTTAVPVEVFSLGHFATTGPYAFGGNLWHMAFGVLADGAGGIILFNGEAEAWQRWRP